MKEFRKPLWKDFSFLVSFACFIAPLVFFNEMGVGTVLGCLFFAIALFLLRASGYNYAHVEDGKVVIHNYFFKRKRKEFAAEDLESVVFERAIGSYGTFFWMLVVPTVPTKRPLRYPIVRVSKEQIKTLILATHELGVAVDYSRIS
ncbi:MAG TPA: hypothetical protein PLK40_00775 [Bacteroidaceae bacterium]|nr:hypothetical protein [Bacteroidaceae bacterium]